jgi:hypothetical protein
LISISSSLIVLILLATTTFFHETGRHEIIPGFCRKVNYFSVGAHKGKDRDFKSYKLTWELNHKLSRYYTNIEVWQTYENLAQGVGQRNSSNTLHMKYPKDEIDFSLFH